MNICIGIISYLPDKDTIRKVRSEKLLMLLKKAKEIFNVDILIVAQNWKDFNVDNLEYCRVTRYNNKLGITGARRALRKTFLDSNYDYLIMLDDDSELIGTARDGQIYLKDLESNPNKWAAYKPMLLKLFAISKDVYRTIDFPDGEAENGDFFEDMWMYRYLEHVYPKKRFYFTRSGLIEKSDSAHDPYSTWFHKQFNKHEIGDRTRKIISELDNRDKSVEDYKGFYG